jgi:hypothetical protein
MLRSTTADRRSRCSCSSGTLVGGLTFRSPGRRHCHGALTADPARGNFLSDNVLVNDYQQQLNNEFARRAAETRAREARALQELEERQAAVPHLTSELKELGQACALLLQDVDAPLLPTATLQKRFLREDPVVVAGPPYWSLRWFYLDQHGVFAIHSGNGHPYVSLIGGRPHLQPNHRYGKPRPLRWSPAPTYRIGYPNCTLRTGTMVPINLAQVAEASPEGGDGLRILGGKLVDRSESVNGSGSFKEVFEEILAATVELAFGRKTFE